MCDALPSYCLDSFNSVLCRSCQVVRTHWSFSQPIAGYFSSREQLRGFCRSDTADCDLASIPSASIDTLHNRRCHQMDGSQHVDDTEISAGTKATLYLLGQPWDR